MPFSRRIGLFLFGLLMGSTIVYSLFKGRLPSWLPETVVLESLQKQPLKLTDKSQCQINCMPMDTVEINKSLRLGDVIFSKSDVKKTPCPYYLIEWVNEENNTIELIFERCDSSSTLIEIKSHPLLTNCNCP
jgi:hypothetical protein